MPEETKPDETPDDPHDIADPDDTPIQPEVTPSPTAGAASSSLPADLISRATAAGISAEEIKDFDEKALTRTLAVLEKHKPEKPAEKPAEKPVEKLPEEWKVPWEDLVAEEEDADEKGKPIGKIVHPSIQKVINSIHAHYKEKLTKQEEMVRMLWEDAQQRRAQEGLDMIDGLFSSVEEVYPELGKGKRSKLDSESREYKLTATIVSQMEMLAQHYQKQGKKIPANEALRDEVLETLYGKREKDKEVKERPRDERTGQFVTPTAKPTHRNGAAPKGMTREEQTISELDEKLRARGLTASSANESLATLQEGLLG